MKSDVFLIKEAAAKRGIKFSFIAKKAGISPAYMTLILQKRRPLLKKHREKIFKLLNL